MAGLQERRFPWSAMPGGAVPPTVVCVLNGTLPGRAAAAHAAALSRGLQWPLGLVAGGLQPLDRETLVDEVVGERAGIAVVPIESFSESAEAVWLAERTRVPVVIVPAGWHSDGESRPQEVTAHDRRALDELWGAEPVMIVPEPHALRQRRSARSPSGAPRSTLRGR